MPALDVAVCYCASFACRQAAVSIVWYSESTSLIAACRTMLTAVGSVPKIVCQRRRSTIWQAGKTRQCELRSRRHRSGERFVVKTESHVAQRKCDGRSRILIDRHSCYE